MKRASVLVFLIIGLVSLSVSAQNARPTSALNPENGFISINELNAGVGLGITDVPYAKSFFGFTTINGYQINKNFVAAGGTGILAYNGGVLVPLFLDFRYSFNAENFIPYFWADGGFLLNFKDFKKGTKQFINPGFGVRKAFSEEIAATLGAGFFFQSGGSRDSFINFKGGVIYKF